MMIDHYSTENNRCKRCKFSYIGEQYTHTVLPPQRMCGKLDSPCKSGPCDYYEPKNDNGYSFDGSWTVTSNSGN